MGRYKTWGETTGTMLTLTLTLLNLNHNSTDSSNPNSVHNTENISRSTHILSHAQTYNSLYKSAIMELLDSSAIMVICWMWMELLMQMFTLKYESINKNLHNWRLCLYCPYYAFSALMLLVWQQEGHPACTEWWGAGVVICLERGADLHTAQLMPLPSTVSCFSKIQIVFTFLVPAHPGSPGQSTVKRVCVCVWKGSYTHIVCRVACSMAVECGWLKKKIRQHFKTLRQEQFDFYVWC